MFTINPFRSPQRQPSPPGPAYTRAQNVNFAIASIVTILAAVVPAVWWIGDISWIQDEPRLIAKAYHANRERTLETRGLHGNFALPYGPLPTQIYQGMLLITHDPVRLAGIRAGTCAGVTAIGLLWLAWALRFNPWFITAVVLAPYLWNFHRILWDASFAIPFGALAMGGYAAFLRTACRRALFTALASVLALIFIHPQDLPLLTPIAAHMLWRHRGALARHYIGVAVILGIVFALNAGYPRRVFDAIAWQMAVGKVQTQYPMQPPPRWLAMLSPFLGGGSMLAGDKYVPNDTTLPDARLVWVATRGSMIIYPVIWLGIGAAAFHLINRWRRGARADEGRDASLESARRSMYAISLAGLVLLFLLHGGTRIPISPQYFFGTFALHVFFACVGIETLRRIRLQSVTIAVYGLSVGFIVVVSAIHLHEKGYRRVLQRPSLANQTQVARELSRYADQSVKTDVEIFTRFEQSIRTLRLLCPPASGQAQTTHGNLMIRYRSGPNGPDSAIELIELPAGENPPGPWWNLDVTPLPPDWHPATW